MAEGEVGIVPDPPEGWSENQPWQSDTQAAAENSQFGKLDEIENLKKVNRRKVHMVLGWCLPATVVFAFCLFWAGITIYAIHVATSWNWLKPEQLKELHTLLFSGALGAVVIQGARRYLD